jgi:hypothetical protein
MPPLHPLLLLLLLQVQDPVLADAKRWGYQGLQPWQQEVLDKVVAGPLALLQQKAATLTD